MTNGDETKVIANGVIFLTTIKKKKTDTEYGNLNSSNMIPNYVTKNYESDSHQLIFGGQMKRFLLRTRRIDPCAHLSLVISLC